MVKDPKNQTDQSILMPVTKFTAPLAAHQNWQRWILGTKPSRHREGRCWLCQCQGPRCTGLTHRIRRSLLRRAAGSVCTWKLILQMSFKPGRKPPRWDDVKSKFRCYTALPPFFMIMLNAFTSTGDAECLTLCRPQHTRQVGTISSLGFFNMKKYKTE